MANQSEKEFYSYTLKYNNKACYPIYFYDDITKQNDQEFFLVAIKNDELYEDYITGDKLYLSDENLPEFDPLLPEDKVVYNDINQIDKNKVASLLKKMLDNSALLAYYRSMVDNAKKEYELEYFKKIADIKVKEAKEEYINNIFDNFEKNVRRVK